MTISITTLIEQAISASQNAYVPYSNYHVGAALLSTDNQVFTGCNVENSAYPAGICAERTAVVKAVSEGVKDFQTIVVATKNAGSPCGICRQVMNEFAPQMRVVLVDFDGAIALDTTVADLLPAGFSKQDLNITE